MLYRSKALKGYTLHSLDGEIGKVREFYFDDHFWTIRYLVVNTGNWLMDREVLISPCALIGVNKDNQNISINLTNKQIEDSPLWDTDKPVSRQFEESYYEYYGWPMYWSGPYMWGAFPYIESSPMIGKEKMSKNSIQSDQWDSHLRSTLDVSGSSIQATDGEIGRVEDFIVDEKTWAIRYLIINTGNLWPGKKILVSPKWIESIGWSKKKVFINLLREDIRKSPEYTDESLLTREYETVLHKHYNCDGYWVNEQNSKK